MRDIGGIYKVGRVGPGRAPSTRSSTPNALAPLASFYPHHPHHHHHHVRHWQAVSHRQGRRRSEARLREIDDRALRRQAQGQVRLCRVLGPAREPEVHLAVDRRQAQLELQRERALVDPEGQERRRPRGEQCVDDRRSRHESDCIIVHACIGRRLTVVSLTHVRSRIPHFPRE